MKSKEAHTDIMGKRRSCFSYCFFLLLGSLLIDTRVFGSPTINSLGYRKERGSIVHDSWCSVVGNSECSSCPDVGESNPVGGCLYSDISRTSADGTIWTRDDIEADNSVHRGKFLIVVDIPFPPASAVSGGVYNVTGCASSSSLTDASGNCGTIAELGGDSIGFWLGISRNGMNDVGPSLFVTAGNGGWGDSTAPPSDAASINIPLPDPMIPLDGETHEIAVLTDPTSGAAYIQLFIDGVPIGKDFPSGGSMRANKWEGGDQGGLGKVGNKVAALTVANKQPWPFGTTGRLRAWRWSSASMDLYKSSNDELHLNLDCTKFSTLYFYASPVSSTGDFLSLSAVSFNDGDGQPLSYVGGSAYPLTHIWKKTYDPCNLNNQSNFAFSSRNQTVTITATSGGSSTQLQLPPVIVYYLGAFVYVNSLIDDNPSPNNCIAESGLCTLRSAYYACQTLAARNESTVDDPFLCEVRMPDDNLYLMQDDLYGHTFNESMSINNLIVMYRNKTTMNTHYTHGSCCYSCMVQGDANPHMCSYVYIG